MKKVIIILFLLIITIPSNTFAKEGAIQLFFVDPIKNKTPIDKCENEACQVLLSKINNAQKTIYFAIYGISDMPEIFNALVNAQKRGIAVKGVVDKDLADKSIYKDTDSLIKALRRNNINTDYLKDDKILGQDLTVAPDFPQKLKYYAGNKLITSEFKATFLFDIRKAIMHDKFFIIDNNYVWTGSTNVSSTCMNYNSNVVVSINSQKISQIYTKEFNQMFFDDVFHNLKQKISNKENIKLNKDTNISIYFSPKDKIFDDQLKKRIYGAKKYIYVPMFFLTHKKIPQYLIDAHTRGIDVKIIIDANSAENEYSKHEILRIAGIPLKVENFGGKMHMKSAIIDDEWLIIGSLNWTSSGEKFNDENTLIIKNKDLAYQYRQHFEYLWSLIPDTYEEIGSNPGAETPQSGYSCFDGIDNNHNKIYDLNEPSCQQSVKMLKKHLK